MPRSTSAERPICTSVTCHFAACVGREPAICGWRHLHGLSGSPSLTSSRSPLALPQPPPTTALTTPPPRRGVLLLPLTRPPASANRTAAGIPLGRRLRLCQPLCTPHEPRFFTASDERFRPILEDWVSTGVCRPWRGRLGRHHGGGTGKFVPAPATAPVAFIGAHGMGSISASLGARVDVVQDVWVSGLHKAEVAVGVGTSHDAASHPARWQLSAGQRSLGEFDYVVRDLSRPPRRACPALWLTRPIAHGLTPCHRP